MTVRRPTIARAAYGIVLLLSPRYVVERVAGERPGGTVRAARRLLGGRHLLQAAAIARNPTRKRRLLGVAMDLTHALTMVPVVACTDRRRCGALSALVALVFASLEVRSMLD